MKNINNIFKGSIIILVMFSFVFTGLSTAYNSHISFYEKEENPYMNSFFSTIYNKKLFKFFLTYTGLDTGYGFFSPNVASDLVIYHTTYANGEYQTFKSSDFLQTIEGKNRFHGLQAIYMEKLELVDTILKQDKLRGEYLKIILKQLNRYYLKEMSIDSINSTVFLYHYPFLKDYPNTKDDYIPIESITTSNEKN